MEIRWEVSSGSGSGPDSVKSLRIGAPVKEDPTKHYGTLSDFPAAFTIEAESLFPFMAEFHATRVLSFRPQTVRRIVLQTETRNLAYARRKRPTGVPADWSPEPGTPSQGVDLSRFNSLIEGLSELRTPRFIQYQGDFPPGAGLDRPRLSIQVECEGSPEPLRIRIGSRFLDDWVCAAVGEGEAGPVFLLVGPVWEAMIAGAEGGLPPIPDLPFAPAATP